MSIKLLLTRTLFILSFINLSICKLYLQSILKTVRLCKFTLFLGKLRLSSVEILLIDRHLGKCLVPPGRCNVVAGPRVIVLLCIKKVRRFPMVVSVCLIEVLEQFLL